MGTTARLGIDITATDRTRAAFGSTQRSLAAIERSAKQVKIAFGGIVGGNLLASAISGLVRVNAQVKPVADSFERLKAALQNFALRVGDAGVNQALISFSRNIALMITGTDGLARSIAGFVAGGIRGLEMVFIGIGRAAAFVYDNFETFKNAIIGFAAVSIATRVFAIAQAFVKLTLAIRAASLVSVLHHAISRRGIILYVGMAAIIAKLTGTFDELKASMAAVWQWAEKLVPTLGDELNGALQALGLNTDAFTTDFDKFAGQLAALPAVIDGNEKAVQKFAKGYKILDGNLKDTKDSQDKFTESMQSSVSQGLQSFAGSLTEVAQGTTTLKDAFSSTISSVIQDLTRLFVSQAFQALLGLLGGGGGGALAAVLPGVGPGGMGFLHFGGPRAAGGPVSPGKAYTVGEHGPETFMPGTSGAIIPSRGGGGGGITIIDQRSNGEAVRPQRDGNGNWKIVLRDAVRSGVADFMAGDQGSKLMNVKYGLRPPTARKSRS